MLNLEHNKNYTNCRRMSDIPLSLHSRAMRFDDIFISLLSLILFATGASSADTFNSSQSLVKGQTLVSYSDVFQLGFFTLDNSRWYVGIWYKNIPETTYVWVANRDNPIRNSSSAALRIGDGGRLVILEDRDGAMSVTWSGNRLAAANPISPVVELLDNGNLVVREANDSGNEQKYIWQSFDFPTDTLLPGMKLGTNLKSGLNRYLTSWKSTTDPSSGQESFRLNISEIPEAVMVIGQNEMAYRSGPWNGFTFANMPLMGSSQSIYSVFINDHTEVCYSYLLTNQSIITRLVINSTNTLLERTIWKMDTWIVYWSFPVDECDSYSRCGPYGICETTTIPMCNCTSGFKPKNPKHWSVNDWSDGCVRQTALDCSTDGFLRLQGMKLPDNGKAYSNEEMSLDECQQACSRSCSCTAFAKENIGNGALGCVTWTGELLDLKLDATRGQDIYVKLAYSDIYPNSSNKFSRPALIAVVSIAGGAFLLGLAVCLLWKCKTRKARLRGTRKRIRARLVNEAAVASKGDSFSDTKPEELDLPLLDFKTIAQATDNFSDQNKLGKGGFGCVYKGTLEEGLEIAVKRLSTDSGSGQGIEEFKTEVRLIARLQHVNLVRLLGCCIEMEEKMLIYEFMENKSLDSILFNKSNSSILNWPRRFKIISGTARGLLYLHQDSRFRIIHRDLKASNILLDKEFNPKISDFGMARIFGRDQIEANTRRVMGTYGYMSPEYAMHGLFSVKSDVFSFGVSVLEIISGNKNKGFYYDGNELNLLGHAWKLWKEEKATELLDPAFGSSCPMEEVLRCIQVGLLCVQEHAEDRPVMSDVLMMLGSETTAVPQPKKPGFFLGRNAETSPTLSQEDKLGSMNIVTITAVQGR